MPVLWLSILEAVYLSYTFHFLQTSVDFNIIDSPSNVFFKHPIGNAKVCRICPFGQYAIVILIGMLILRNFIHIPPSVVLGSILLAMLVSLINLNAMVYLIPVALIESYRFLAHLQHESRS